MTSARTSAGDPALTLQLLWRQPAAVPRRGPERGLDLDAIVAAATEVADREGLGAVTMRRVAQALDVGAMTLYTYVPSKAELLDLMLDAAYDRMPRTDTTGQPWRQRLTAIAAENRALYDAHPWTAAVSTLRPPLGPGMLAKYEHELSALDERAYPLAARVGTAAGTAHRGAYDPDHFYDFGLQRVLDGLEALIAPPAAGLSGGHQL